MKRGIVDRFEGDFAIVELENGFERIPRSKLPEGVKEGDSVNISAGGTTIDHEDTDKRRKKIKALMDKLFQ